MGHLVGKDIYKRLGDTIDGHVTRVPKSEALYALLKELYSEDEAHLVVTMPYGLSSLGRLMRTTGRTEQELRRLLDGLTAKGLVMDLFLREKYYYMPSPMVVGIFEFSMMRSGPEVDSRKLAGLFKTMMNEGETFYQANLAKGQKVSILRTLPHADAFDEDDYVEVLDYEKAEELVNKAQRYAIGICSCRHEKHHLDEKECDVPLESCISFDYAAEFLARKGLAREVDKAELLDNMKLSREKGLVLNADNVQKRVQFMCQCCGCCCNLINGIKKHGYANTIVTSNYIVKVNPDRCIGCGKCAKACPVDALTIAATPEARSKNGRMPVLTEDFCIGCGVCNLDCPTNALSMEKRTSRVLHPETTFERVILQSLERGTLQNQLFDDPNKLTQKVLRSILGAFFRLPPVQKGLMSDALRSRFLTAMKQGAGGLGKGWQSGM